MVLPKGKTMDWSGLLEPVKDSIGMKWFILLPKGELGREGLAESTRAKPGKENSPKARESVWNVVVRPAEDCCPKARQKIG